MNDSEAVTKQFVEAENYSVQFKNCRLDDEKHFVPQYALHRPNCKTALSGKFPEPDTHKMVHSIMKARPGSMIHAGTFYGDMLPSFSRACQRMVYAFEPVMENYILANLCIEANDLKNVMLLNAALGAECKISRISVQGDNGLHRGGASQISRNKGRAIPLMTIDQLGIDDLSIIQLDVEGFELPALQGASATIRRCRPIIMIEDNKKNCARYLSRLSYAQIGSIPGMVIWASAPFKKMARGFLEDIQAEQ